MCLGDLVFQLPVYGNLFGVKCGSCLLHVFGLIFSGSKNCETKVAGTCPLGRRQRGLLHEESQAEGYGWQRAWQFNATPMEWPPTVLYWESRAGLAVGTKVSLSPEITATTLVMGQVQGQSRKQAHEVGIRRCKAGHWHGATQARTHDEGWSSKAAPSRGGVALNMPLTAHLLPAQTKTWELAPSTGSHRTGGKRTQNCQVCSGLCQPQSGDEYDHQDPRYIWELGNLLVSHTRVTLSWLDLARPLSGLPCFQVVHGAFPIPLLSPFHKHKHKPLQHKPFHPPVLETEFSYLQLSDLPAPVCQEHGVSSFHTLFLVNTVNSTHKKCFFLT